MSTERKLSKQAIKRSVSGSPVDMEKISVFQITMDWSDDQEFISPNDVPTRAIGLLYCLTTKYLINGSFTALYNRSLKLTWMDLLNRERRNLKPNDISVEKCFMLNRLIIECTKNPLRFAQETGELYEEIKAKMSCILSTSWSIDYFYSQVQSLQRLQSQRRLFHITSNEINQVANLLTLQQIASTLYSQFLRSCQSNRTVENYNILKRLLRQSFIIVTQPSIPECAAATKYEKSGQTYTAKLSARIICLLDSETIGRSITLSTVGTKLHPMDRQVDEFGEDQEALEWSKRSIMCADESLKEFFYAELQSIQLNKFDGRNARPLYSAKVCQLQFQWTVAIDDLNIEENLVVLSQPFGLCSHAQYYPEYVAQVLLHEVSSSSEHVTPPDVLTNYVNRYQIRVSGVEVKPHTSQYISSVLHAAYEPQRNIHKITSLTVYGDILTKLISQMEMFIDHPFLSMMYHDGLFHGICDSSIDQQLRGTCQQPRILLRFNSLLTQQPTQNASVLFIVHNGQLIQASFQTKVFVDEMCRVICEVHRYRENRTRLLHEFSLYFHEQLFRLNPAASPMNDTYQSVIPVLWNTMRMNTDSSPFTTVDQSSVTATNTNTKGTAGILIQQLVDKLSDLLVKSSQGSCSSEESVSALLATLSDAQQKELLSNLLHARFQSKSSADAATQTPLYSPDDFFDP